MPLSVSTEHPEASRGCIGLGKRFRPALFAAAVLLAAGCASPIGVKHLQPEEANRAVASNVLNTGAYSAYAGRVLQRLGLTERFEESPAAVLAELHSGLGGNDDPDRLLALSELSFLHGMESGDRSYFLAAAAYAWGFLFPPGEPPQANPFEDRLRLAADLYNRAIALGLRADEGNLVDLRPRRVELFFGPLDLRSDPNELMYAGYRLENFVSLADLSVYGLRNRYRQRGIGAPLAGSIERVEGVAANRWIGPYAKIPVTLVVRFGDVRDGAGTDGLEAVAEVSDPDVNTSIEVGANVVPLESDSSAALAYRLDRSPVWDFEIAGFRRGDFRVGNRPDSNLFMLEPYRPGLIPVVFVHGTASSPARWADMGNELMSDPDVASRYQLWFFLYNTGNPIAVSAAQLRQSLKDVIADVDPKGADSALRKMVLIGHSQGGLLVKLMVVDSGTRFWDAVAKTPFAEAKISDKTRKVMEETIIVAPQPHVKRVVFIATPHRGSFMARGFFGNLARRLVRLPANLLKASRDVVQLDLASVVGKPFKIPTSIDNMNPSNPFVRTLVSLPIAGGVTAHSIIPVKGDGAYETGNDGIVEYQSAHIEGVESELVVRWEHSVQSRPEAIEEVRRILYEHSATDATNAESAETKAAAPMGAPR